jgi:hypothetical protein
MYLSVVATETCPSSIRGCTDVIRVEIPNWRYGWVLKGRISLSLGFEARSMRAIALNRIPSASLRDLDATWLFRLVALEFG